MQSSSGELAGASASSLAGTDFGPHPKPKTRTKRPYDYSKPRPNYPRARTGCLPCRARKKKCDEARPECAGCQRNHLLCKWQNAKAEENDVSNDTRLTATVARGKATTSKHVSGQTTERHSRSLLAHDAQSLPVSLHCTPQACALTAVSGTIFTHYVEHTSGLLAAVPHSESPFFTVVLPLAQGDETIMHCVLALSGTHLAFRRLLASAAMDDTGADAFELAAVSHYTKALGGLRHQLQRMNTSDYREKIKILLLLVMLSQFEV